MALEKKDAHLGFEYYRSRLPPLCCGALANRTRNVRSTVPFYSRVHGSDDSGRGDDNDKREEGFVEQHRQECMKAVEGSCRLSVFRMILDSEGHEMALYKILSITGDNCRLIASEGITTQQKSAAVE